MLICDKKVVLNTFLHDLDFTWTSSGLHRNSTQSSYENLAGTGTYKDFAGTLQGVQGLCKDFAGSPQKHVGESFLKGVRVCHSAPKPA
ncbi:hypothetical protein M378DRAFT_17785 [Amanita muscaria Koide BX008]|uniref:Uncharacterized protein n=1 Tax=Amanita muscaria (strain Koide BX008) TaxID=946122 RepID=A0A0C2SNQ6_AMAMK|nr:hypothetical protein M378DRAFT_17785 [Amanita muscaria Koide BX008]